MNFVYILVLIFLTLSSCLNLIRWGRVAQREHYIPGYVTKFYFRWVRLVPFNNLYFFLAINKKGIVFNFKPVHLNLNRHLPAENLLKLTLRELTILKLTILTIQLIPHM